MTSKNKRRRQNARMKRRTRYLKEANRDGYIVDKYGHVAHREMWKTFYDTPPKGWDIHHIDFDKTNNHIDNLIALPHAYHNKIHFEMDRGRPRYTREELWPKYLEFLDLYDTLVGRLDAAQAIVDACEEQLRDLGGLSWADKQNYKGKQVVRYVPPSVSVPVKEFVATTILRKKSGT